MNILAIDQGTSSTKALVCAPDGGILSQVEVPVGSSAHGSDGVEQDPEELWSSVLSAGRQALAEAGGDVAAVALANQGETVLAWDRNSAKPLSAAISWQDRRSLRICDRLAAHGEWLRSTTGLPLDPYFSAPKIAWLRESVTKDGVCTTTDAWLLARLSGAFVTDAATASRTLLLDLDSGAWSEPACALFAIDPQQLPRVVPCAGVVGETTAFGPRLALSGLAVDQQAALFGESCHAPGQAKCTYGTGAFLLTTIGLQARRSTNALATCVAWRVGDQLTYCLDGQVYAAGAAVTWLMRTGIIGSASALDSCGAGDSEVVFVPALAGLAAPFWRPQARAVFAGLSLASERVDLVRAVINGIAAQVAWLARAVAEDLSQALACLRVDGGLTRSRVLMQTQADLLQMPIEVYPSPHATALGVAALARLGLGAVNIPAAAVGAWQASAIYEPQISRDQAESRLRRWRQVVDATMEL